MVFCMLLVQFVALLPLTWWLYTTGQTRKNTMLNLQMALGRSAADLDFLRAQINPHFLFNALNTLYGTALQENAVNTSEGIQKLGDMMRFMLDENHLEKIPMHKEVAYLQNYISLQRLRTQGAADIQINVNIEENFCEHDIAPMLLIPFVENAFKYGISLRNRSRIAISLSCDAEKIYFDVSNTTHTRPEHDPEKEGRGIGLNNVKNRLALLYPERHELSIRQTATEYFVHLTIHVK
jgi:LytS/YehU family sensor histidine kinase